MELGHDKNLATPSNTSATRQALERETELIDDLIEYASTTFGDEAMAQAWIDFTGIENEDDAEGLDDDDPINDVFLPWFVFNWMPDEKQTIAELYVANKGDELAATDQALIAAFGRHPVSFFEIKKTAKDGMVELHDLILGHDKVVFDESIAEEGVVGDVMFGAIRHAHGDIGQTLAAAPFFLDHEMVDEVAKLREAILKATGAETVSAEALETYQTDVIGFFLDSFGDGDDEGSGADA